MSKFFGNGKSVAGGVIAAIGVFLGFMGVDPGIVKLVEGLGVSLFGIGIAHKIQKVVDK